MSTPRHASIDIYPNGQAYLFLAPFEHGDYHDSVAYGPFENEEAAEFYLFNGPHSNPGGLCTGHVKGEPPKVSPNGHPVQVPRKVYSRW
jgi:hypothetical protein